MFWIDEEDGIHLTVGDTGAFYITATDYTFAPEDRVLWTVRNSAREIVFERTYALAGGVGQTNGKVFVALANADTDMLPPGIYSWDARYVINPHYNANGKMVDGDVVITPKTARMFELLSAEGEV